MELNEPYVNLNKLFKYVCDVNVLHFETDADVLYLGDGYVLVSKTLSDIVQRIGIRTVFMEVAIAGKGAYRGWKVDISDIARIGREYDWNYMLGVLERNQKKYDDAVGYAKDVLEINDADALTKSSLAVKRLIDE